MLYSFNVTPLTYVKTDSKWLKKLLPKCIKFYHSI